MVYTYPTNITGIGDWFSWSNTVIDGQLGLLFMLLSYIIPFLILKGSSSDKAFAGASFFGFLMSVMLFRIQMITSVHLAIAIVLLVTAVILARSEREKIGL